MEPEIDIFQQTPGLLEAYQYHESVEYADVVVPDVPELSAEELLAERESRLKFLEKYERPAFDPFDLAEMQEAQAVRDLMVKEATEAEDRLNYTAGNPIISRMLTRASVAPKVTFREIPRFELSPFSEPFMVPRARRDFSFNTVTFRAQTFAEQYGLIAPFNVTRRILRIYMKTEFLFPVPMGGVMSLEAFTDVSGGNVLSSLNPAGGVCTAKSRIVWTIADLSTGAFRTFRTPKTLLARTAHSTQDPTTLVRTMTGEALLSTPDFAVNVGEWVLASVQNTHEADARLGMLDQDFLDFGYRVGSLSFRNEY
ncbi:MAG: hypothetical protein ABL949_09480 [Fimbriimonadaceae bacterium]